MFPIDQRYMSAVKQWKMESTVEVSQEAVQRVAEAVKNTTAPIMQTSIGSGVPAETLIIRLAMIIDGKEETLILNKLAAATPEQKTVLAKVYSLVESELGTAAKAATLFFGIFHVKGTLLFENEKARNNVKELKQKLQELIDILAGLDKDDPRRPQVEQIVEDYKRYLEEVKHDLLELGVTLDL